MNEVELYPYILLGDSMRFLRNVREGLSIKQTHDPNDLSLNDHMDRIFGELGKMKLTVTHEAFLGEFGDISYEFYELPKDSKETLTKQQANIIIQGMKLITSILKYESTKLRAYIVAEKRLPVEKLLSDVASMFGKNVFEALPDLAQYDFKQAGKCIAFEVPTAAAFHTLRGTEGVLRSYYAALVPTDGKRSNLLWGAIVLELRNMKTDLPAKELLDNLDNIRTSFRNPTQHPEKVYDLDEAQDLFNLCVDVVNRMAKDLFRRKIWSEASEAGEGEIPF
jgi:hypothetical protein